MNSIDFVLSLRLSVTKNKKKKNEMVNDKESVNQNQLFFDVLHLVSLRLLRRYIWFLLHMIHGDLKTICRSQTLKMLRLYSKFFPRSNFS